MKSGNREINIFNMSLLDILCGALGAFCFMMLALFPYYKPKLVQNLGANTATADPKSLAEAEAEIRAARAQIQKLQAMIQALRSNNRQLQAQLAAAQQQNRQLNLRRPILETTLWKLQPEEGPNSAAADVPPGERVDTWLVDAHPASPKDQQRIVFDPSSPPKTFWGGDLNYIYNGTPGATSFVLRDRPSNYDYDVYVNWVPLQNGTPANVLTTFVLQDTMGPSQGLLFRSPWFVLGPQKRYFKAGTIHVDQNSRASFAPSEELRQQILAAGSANSSAMRQKWQDWDPSVQLN